MSTLTPTLVDPTVDQAKHTTPCAEIWYVTCLLESDDRPFVTQAILTTSPSGRLFTMLSMLDLTTGATRHATSQFRATEVEIASAKLDLRSPVATLAGSVDELALQASIGPDGFVLDLRRVAPVLNTCGTGVFPYFSGPTQQYAFPALAVSGMITFNGTSYAVHGGGWFDRQWSASRDAFGNANPFTWFGLCLADGDNLSVWEASGLTWATIGHPDGTHTVTPVALAQEADHWTVSVPFFESRLDITQRRVLKQNNFYTGVCQVTGTWRGAVAAGYGFIDRVSKSSQ